ncbi:MAG: hypothetical protein ABFD54_13030 [Armatimonadota bacterium]|nr:hypothetical protein [bacterium]
MATEKIYIQLLNEGTVVYRPTLGVVVSEGVYRVLPTENYDPEDEVWEFLPGDTVKCTAEVKSGAQGEETVLVAKERVG